ncbi:MAG: helix-turn-helix transcriptional regulator [Liquorilactobacillus hordei]|uniref:Cro CI family transcriptional regulator n=1 Tax=Liquorilactobacillus hordei DSM 19519 TaxID=1423759 RepID=A0A0R1MGF9_9LACO|nr:helix-turn-helix transcriptional regulator [Liquorilactobacillus hordei]KRL07118.1 Cro CI family transcriptional regulator [Liquorilactobacillus hordei DSM 19519]
MIYLFPEQLKALRRGSGLTLSQLAKQLNEMNIDDELRTHPNSGPQIGSWERGINTPSYSEVMKLAIFFGVSLDFIVGRVNQQIDIEKIFTLNNDLIFDGKQLSSKERAESYSILKAYFIGKNLTDSHGSENKESRDYKEITLNFNDKKLTD